MKQLTGIAASRLSVVLGDFKGFQSKSREETKTNHSLEKKSGAVSAASKDGAALESKKGVGQAMGNRRLLYFSLIFSSSGDFGM